jgi:capsule polysaccharide export protein KpsE/RkpR
MKNIRHQNSFREIDVVPIEYPNSPDELDSSGSSARVGNATLLWERRRLLLRAACWALVISIVLVLLIPSRYDSTVTLMPPEPLSSTSAMLEAVVAKSNPSMAAMAGSLLGMKSSGALFAKLTESRAVQDHLVDRFELQKVYSARYKQDARKKLASRTEVVEDRKSGVISIDVTDRDPARARDMAQAYVDELNLLVAEVSTSSARRERIFIEQRLTTVKGELEDAEKQFSVFASKNSALDIKEQTKAMVASAAQLQGQLIATQSQLQGLEQIYTSNNVRVRSMRAQVAELRRQLEKIGGTDASLANDGAQSTELYPSIRKLPLLGVEWADLFRRMKIQETVYELLNQQYELARIQEAKEIPRLNVIDPANLPEKKSWPPRTLLVAGLCIFSLVGAAVWIVGASRWEQIDNQDPRKQLMVNIFESVSMSMHRVWMHPRLARLRHLVTRPESAS